MEDCIDKLLQLTVFQLPFSQNSFVADIPASLAQGLAQYSRNRISCWTAFLCVINPIEYRTIDFPGHQASLDNDWRIRPRMNLNQIQN